MRNTTSVLWLSTSNYPHTSREKITNISINMPTPTQYPLMSVLSTAPADIYRAACAYTRPLCRYREVIGCRSEIDRSDWTKRGVRQRVPRRSPQRSLLYFPQ